MNDLKKLFNNPPSQYRGAPFWSWNDKLEVEELKRQVLDMKAHGMGGFFMHSRDGLETIYMGDEWLECIRETVKTAKEVGSYAWLYDEDRWPSGGAGGLVQAQGGDAYRAKGLTMAKQQTVEPKDNIIAVFEVMLIDDIILESKRLVATESHNAGEDHVLLVFRREVAAFNPWFNDDAPPDNLNPESVAAFIDITYQAYYDEIGDAFGNTVPGIFTDEPNMGTRFVAGDLPKVPWTDGLTIMFEDNRGYDLCDVLPWLFLDGEHTSKARHDFWWTVSERFTQAFSRQIGEWCEEHNLAFTGHFLSEPSFAQGVITGGALMPHYEYQHVPGIDMLTVQTHENLTIKQCTSVAHQFGRDFVLSETYGVSGWEMTFEDQKWEADWQYVLGVSMRCQHLALYSLRGCRKRDYPPSFNYNTTWWKHNNVVEDYFARVGLLTTQGSAIRDVLVLHPVTTAWSMIGDIDNKATGYQKADAYSNQINNFARVVLGTHYDFDFGDEQIMSRHVHIDTEPGELPILWVNQAPYRVLVIPPGTKTLLTSTVEVIESWLTAGGPVIAFSPVPDQCEAAEQASVAALFAHPNVTILHDEAELQTALECIVPRRVSIVDNFGHENPHMLYMQREVDDKTILFIVNLDRHNSYPIKVSLEGYGRLESWDALSGGICPVPVMLTPDAVQAQSTLDAGGSALFVLHQNEQPVLRDDPVILYRPWPGIDRYPTQGYIGPECTFTRTDPNVLTLDSCTFKFGDREWSEETPVWQAQRTLRENLGMTHVYRNGLPQRYKWASEPHEGDGTAASFRFSFKVEAIPDSPVFLVLEGAPEFDIYLNGESIDSNPVGWYIDRAFHKIALPPLVQGTNVLELTCAYHNHMEVEDCFIIGDFAVTPQRVIVKEPETLHFGDWTMQGYLHYAGSMIYHGQFTYHKDMGRIGVALPDYRAITVAVHLNGSLAAQIPWESANFAEITPALFEGDNAIDIEVVGSPRNMLGPLHRRRGYEYYTSWISFRREGIEYTPDYVVIPLGLFEQVRLVSPTANAPIRNTINKQQESA